MNSIIQPIYVYQNSGKLDIKSNKSTILSETIEKASFLSWLHFSSPQ